MAARRVRQLVLIASVAWAAWLLMMLVHEAGHVLGALATGGVVRRVVWHPLAISRTDVDPNPAPLTVVWAGPLVGCLAPVLVAWLLARWWRAGSHLAWAVA